MRGTRWVLAAMLGLVAVIPASEVRATTITGVVYNATNQHYYKMYTTAVGWTTASANAQSVGGYLACIANATENSWIVGNVISGQTPWIGGTDSATEGTWLWVSGETWSYTSWNSGEPNDSGNEDYLTLRPDGLWNDWNAAGTAYYVVEWNNDPNIPADPANLRTTADLEQRIDLAWDDRSTGETGFELEKALGAGSFAQLATPSANVATWSDAAVAAETAYRYRVRATSAAGPSGWSNTLNVTTPPPTVSDIAATVVGARSVRISWTDRAAAETGVELERGLGSPGQGFALITTEAANTTAFIDDNVASEKTYSYRVRVVGPGGKSIYSAEASVTTPLARPSGPTPAPTSGTSVTLLWDDTTAGETGFELSRGNGCPAPTFSPIGTTGPNVTSFADDTVLPERTYSYRMRSFNAAGASEWTAVQCITTPPFAPTDASAVVLTASRVRVTWTDNSKVEDGYQVDRALVADGVFERVTVVGANVAQFEDAGVTQETGYLYRVAAVGVDGRSDWAVAGAVDTAAMLVVRKAAVSRPKGPHKAPSRTRISISGEFDVGGHGVDLSGPATFRVGDATIGIPSFVRSGKAFRFSSPAVKVQLSPVTGSSRVAFKLDTDDSAVAMPDPDGALKVSYGNGAFLAVGTVQIAGDSFAPPKRGAFVDPPLNIVSVVASLKGGGRDKFVLKAAFSSAAGIPAKAPDVHVALGQFDVIVKSDDFTGAAGKWTYRETDLGPRSIALDYLKGTVTVSIQSVNLGAQPAGADPVHVVLEVGAMRFDDTPVMASTGKALKY